MKTCGIYGIKNIANGKWYVGQSLNVFGRKNGHFSKLRRGIHDNDHLQSAFVKHGENSFEFHVLEEVSEDMLDVREKSWISHYGSMERCFGYNYEAGGNIKKHVSDATRTKMSESHKGIRLSGDHRKKISSARKGWVIPDETRKKLFLTVWKKGAENHNYGRHPSKETILKRSKAMIGNKFRQGSVHSQKTRLKMSAAHTGRRHSDESKLRMIESWKIRRQKKEIPNVA